MRAMLAPPPRLVLDTNVALDLFVFRDPAVSHLKDALQSGLVQAVVDDACRAEWLAVLDYPDFSLSPEARQQAAQAFDRYALLLAAAPLPSRPDARLPRCADPDDQKFLELALLAGAQWLLSKDKAVLRLARRTAREGWFQILTPSAWQPPA
ncbi:PIN domain-containing protein [Dyella jiangningensis]|jgi:predicted nucleic acid-binding protein|uniref:PIN domain-containing protein n=1 Tax=Dyella jiangningensis TaxID=1379159 RepID=UPI00240F823B|nr:PIN domain-containing protein [Dyella jiangningensis]MDG2537879.1 PIN domain-containing protein [Dyella jiangningensis]